MLVKNILLVLCLTTLGTVNAYAQAGVDADSTFAQQEQQNSTVVTANDDSEEADAIE